MRLFGGGGTNGDDSAAKARQEASREAIIAGGLPLNATDRLKEQAAKQGTPQHFFTSDLSVNEFLLSREIGYESLGLVMGSSVYQIGWQYIPTSNWWFQNGELESMTLAHSEARRLAMVRMREEATLLGADGVVGVRLTRREMEGHLTEFMAVGTAVRHPEGRKKATGSLSFPISAPRTSGSWKRQVLFPPALGLAPASTSKRRAGGARTPFGDGEISR